MEITFTVDFNRIGILFTLSLHPTYDEPLLNGFTEVECSILKTNTLSSMSKDNSQRMFQFTNMYAYSC